MVDHIILQESKIKAFEIKLKHWFIFYKNGFKVNQFFIILQTVTYFGHIIFWQLCFYVAFA